MPENKTPSLKFVLASGKALDVRKFRVVERLSHPFVVELTGMHPDPDLDCEEFAGEVADFAVGERRSWRGIVRAFEQELVEPAGLSTYRIELVPSLWLLTQRRNHRMFQRMTEPDIALQLLSEWKVPFETRIDRAGYKRRDYRVQYAESDFAFLSRMLEDAGITYWFESVVGKSTMVLSDAPQSAAPRPPIEHVVDASAVPPGDYVTAVRVVRELRPGAYAVRDVDFRLAPTHSLLASSAASARPVEAGLESFHYVPGAFLFEGPADGTPVADDRMAARSSEQEAAALALRRLDAKRGDAKMYAFETGAFDLAPGVRVGISGHPRSDLGPDQPLLLVETVLRGEATERWSMSCRARRSDCAFRPALATPKPKVSGVETATVVGPQGEEIHTDEFGRIRVHFHWDRQTRMNDESSCWVPVSQPWAGAGFGGIHLPRVGQEVIVDFVGGDPDRPMITGRVYTLSQPVPFKLPENKTQSAWKSQSTNATGGYNEIMFEDKAGQELVRVQAERDLHHLIKNDEERTVLRDRTRDVKRNESVTIGNNRTHLVAGTERITVGQNQRTTIGINRFTHIGQIDSTTVGETHTVTIAPPGDEDKATSSSMSHKKIVLDSGAGASLTIDGDKITLQAGTIEVVGRDRADIGSSGPLAINGARVDINGPGPNAARIGDAAPSNVLQGSKTVFIGGGSTVAGGPFNSVDEAGAAACERAHELAKKDPNGRYAGAIYKDHSTGKYYAGEPERFGADGDMPLSSTRPDSDTAGMYTAGSGPDTATGETNTTSSYVDMEEGNAHQYKTEPTGSEQTTTRPTGGA